MPRVALASVSRDAADAGARAADDGGNAVDAALAASLTAAVTHPGMCSLGGGAFVLVWPADGDPVAVDGGVEMPGRGLPGDRVGRGTREVELDFGGGLRTTVGPGSVATPGLLAGCARTAERYGRLPWSRLLAPAEARAREGFPLPRACHEFLVHAWEPIYARDPRGRAALEGGDGRLADPGATVRLEHLAGTLRSLAEDGVGVFYEGELGRRVVEHVRAGGGILTREDLAAYEPAERTPIEARLDGWTVATNPPPAVGGVCLAAMLALCGDRPREAWTADEVARLVRVQEAVMGRRRERLAAADTSAAEVQRLLEAARSGRLERVRGSGATLHTSAVDDEGTACSITLSDGYGSGIVPPGTGMWLNNCLGEHELNPRGLHAREPGVRLPSNMAPTAATGPGGRRLALGSPGSERIPTAVLQVLLDHVRLGMSPEDAVEHPRVHVDPGPLDPGSRTTRVECEPGLPLDAVEAMKGEDGRCPAIRRFPERSLYFGGAELAVWSPASGFGLGADPRRTSGTAVGGG